ncbi:MAG TPA: MFS transporter [Acidimicrobiales bacterium]
MPGRILVDVAPLRESREFRLLFIGTLVGTLGSQLTVVAIPYQVYAETHSSFQVGAVSIAQLVPLIVGALIGGSVGDAVDRRTLILITSVALAMTSAGLAVNSLAAHPSLLAIYLISAVAGGAGGFVNTARNAAVPSLVARRHLVAAYAFTQVTFQLGAVVGPALSGILIGTIHLQWVYATDAITYFVTIVAVLMMAPIPPAAGARRPGIGSVMEGLRYMKGRQPLQGVYLIDINAMVFGMPRALFPALAANVFHNSAGVLGYLYSAVGVGGLLGAATTGWVSRVKRQGLTVILAVIAWGAAITLFGLSRILVLSLILLALAGWADVISAVLRNTILQSSIPEQFRSRMSSIQMAVVQGGPRLGDLESGAVASAVTTEFSIVSGGLACIVGALVLTGLLPGFRRYRDDPQAGGGSSGPASPDGGMAAEAGDG